MDFFSFAIGANESTNTHKSIFVVVSAHLYRSLTMMSSENPGNVKRFHCDFVSLHSILLQVRTCQEIMLYLGYQRSDVFPQVSGPLFLRTPRLPAPPQVHLYSSFALNTDIVNDSCKIFTAHSALTEYLPFSR